MSKRPDRLSPYIEPRISFLIHLPELQRTKVWRRIRVGAERRSLRAQKSGAYHRRRKSLRRCAIREVYERLTLSALRDRSDPRPKCRPVPSLITKAANVPRSTTAAGSGEWALSNTSVTK